MIVVMPLVDDVQTVARAEEVAAKLGVDLTSENDYYSHENMVRIYINSRGISVKLPEMEKEKPLFIDFSSSKMQYRQKNSGTRKELIARAVGLKAGESPLILDTTAGLGGDSFILATLGAQILMLERNPIIHLLLEDALDRASNDAGLYNIVSRMKLINADSRSFLDNLDIQPDIIYMDPMFSGKEQNRTK